MPGKTMADEQYCSVHSRQVSEPLIASAPRTDFWVLLEYPYPLSAKALKQNQLPDEVNNYLAALQDALPTSRVLLTRKKLSKPGSSPSLVLADGREGRTGFIRSTSPAIRTCWEWIYLRFSLAACKTLQPSRRSFIPCLRQR